jgi:hypothetical protein
MIVRPVVTGMNHCDLSEQLQEPSHWLACDSPGPEAYLSLFIPFSSRFLSRLP